MASGSPGGTRPSARAWRDKARREAAEVAEPVVGYLDWAAWQREYLAEACSTCGCCTRLERGLAWWRSALQGAPAALELQCDHPRPARLSSDGGSVAVHVEGGVAGAGAQ